MKNLLVLLPIFLMAAQVEAMPVETGTDMGVAILDFPDPVVTGSLLTYAVEVSNLGPQTGTNATLEFFVASGVTNVATDFSGCTVAGLGVTCLFPTINVGQKFDVGISALVTALAGSTISAAAAVDALENDVVEENNVATEFTLVATAPVPLPPAIWLLGSALGLLGWMRRRTA